MPSSVRNGTLPIIREAGPAVLYNRAVPFVTIAGHKLEYAWIGAPASAAPTIVFLHEGLGCVSLWRDFPAAVAAATGCGALVYSRWGYGASDPLDGPRSVGFMHDEALETLPAVLGALGVHDPILFGHSDGGSIALIYAGAGAGPVRALALEAPHVFVEDVSVASIARMKTLYEAGDLKARFARYHGENTEGAFRGWNDVWLLPEFRHWNIEASLARITCPILVIQGEDDEYGTMKQVDAIARQVRGPVERLRLAGCGHAPHVDQRTAVLDAVTGFIARVIGPGPGQLT